MKIRNNISILIFVVTILICPCIFAADYTQHENFGNKIPGDVISFTVTPPGTVLTGSVQNPGGFIWTGGPASFTGTIPEDFAGSHNGLFTGTYQPPEGGEGEGKPHTFTWETTTEAVVVKVASITPASQTVCLGTETEFQVETDPAGHYDMISVSVSGATVVTAYNTSTGKIKVKFDQVSTSSTDYKTVTATLGTSSKTANTLVAEVASIEGPSAVCLGAPETFIATPAPIDASFPSGSPKWQYKKIGGGSGGGSPWVNAGSGPTTTITFAEIGKYKVKTKCGESEVEVEVTVIVTGPWSDITIVVGVEAPPALVGKIEEAINKIPGVNVNLKEVTADFSAKARDCCKDGVLIDNGERYKEGELTLSAELKDITIWGPPTFEEEFNFGILIVVIDFEVGVKLDSDFSVAGTLGKRWDDCTPEECLYGSVNAAATIAGKATLDVISCVETFWTTKKCADITVKPAAVSVGLEGIVRYNSKDACDGLSGEVNLKDIVFSAEFKVAGKKIEFKRVIYP